jgi:ADP-dependent phosphofructokinase/glucokinase
LQHQIILVILEFFVDIPSKMSETVGYKLFVDAIKRGEVDKVQSLINEHEGADLLAMLNWHDPNNEVIVLLSYLYATA